ncbi:C1 family peptidase [Thermus sp.]|uniref:C1 family peptidase n=1 Tax=Thermus sp. TaxID=275 RepID=UPI002635E6E5|nr:C1 family peptidase [Thermus sp.]MCX7849493.1 C1 family peptidase [Thermus sp.]
MKPLIRALAVTLLAFLSCTAPPATDSPTPRHRPFLKAEDGSLIALHTPEEVEEAESYYKMRLEDGYEAILEEDKTPSRTQGDPLYPLSLPPSVDLRANQTPIRNQNPRGTCTSFAIAALLEAAYKRLHGLELDLSEEWINGVQKMGILLSTGSPGAPIPLPLRENTIYILSGGGVAWGLDHVLRYGVPEESYWGYNRIGFIDKPDDPGDIPRVLWDGPPMERQDFLDTFNLTEQGWRVETLGPDGRPLHTPYTVFLDPFPRLARQHAVYGPSHIVYIPQTELRNLDWYKRQLAEGREIAFSVLLKGKEDSRLNFRDGIWIPGTTNIGGHAMLMVGYNDARRTFLVKNSWGRDGRGQGYPIEADRDGDGFVEFSYDWVTDGLVYEAAVLRGVRSPGGFSPAFGLGYWKLSLDDLVTRDLSIYHLPKTVPSAALRRSFAGTPPRAVDRRLGTFHVPASPGFRVNGETLPELRFLRFWLLPDSASEPWRGLDARVIDTEEHRVFFFRSGRFATGWTGERGLLLYRGIDRPRGMGVGGPPRAEAFAGHWIIHDDDTSVPLGAEPRIGELYLYNYQGVLTGVYVYQGRQHSVKVGYSPNYPKRIQFEVSGLYNRDSAKTFVGVMMGGNTGLIVGQSGYFVGIFPFFNGFYAVRLGP